MNYLPLALLALSGVAFAQGPPTTTTQTQTPTTTGSGMASPLAPVDRPSAQPVSVDTGTMGAAPAANLPMKKNWSRAQRSSRAPLIGPSGQRPEFDNGGPN